MPPDLTSFFSSIMNDPQALLELIGVILAIIGLLLAISPKIYRWLRNYLDRRSLKKRLGAELYTKEDIVRATKFYIKPDCQDVDPSQEADIRAVHAVKNKLFETVDGLLQNPEKFKYLIVLADSGMGKTAFVLNYYARHWRSSFRRRKFKIALVPLGIKDADSQIQKIEDQSDTVLFLDAFDEDTRAIKNHRQRLADLLELCSGFRQILITCRTQFFRKEEEIPREAGIIKFSTIDLGDNREYIFYKLYLSPFTDEQVKRYLKQRFHFWQRNKCRRVQEIINKIQQLTVRPMLLAYIPELVKSNKQFSYSFQLYEEMVDKWLEREKPFVRNKEELRSFSEQLAIDLYQKRGTRGAEKVHYSEIAPLAQSFGINLKDWQLRGRSLLNRDVAGNYKFAHRSIMEYLFVKRFLELKPAERFKIEWTDQMKKFLLEMICQEAEVNHKFPDLSQIILTQFDLKELMRLKFTPIIKLRSKHQRLSTEQVTRMLNQHDFFDSIYNKKGKGIQHLYLELGDESRVVFDLATGLMWQQGGSSEPMKFEEVQNWIADLNRKRYAGYNDWRLPTLEEAMSLMEPKKLNKDLYIDQVFGSQQRWIWTSDPYSGAAGAPWVVVFRGGSCDSSYLSINYYVRAVRFGQSSP